MSLKTILLVEDNPDDELLTFRALKKNNITNQVVVARDGAEALEILHGEKAAASLPQLVLLDLKLPKIDGLEVLKRIRSHPRTKNLAVVVLTSSSEETDMVKSYNLGCNSYVSKPIDFLDFNEAVRQLGLYWLILNQQPSGAR